MPVPWEKLPNLYDLEYHHIATVHVLDHDASDSDQYFFLDGIKYNSELQYRKWKRAKWIPTDQTIRIGSAKPPTVDFCVRNVRLLRGMSGDDSGHDDSRHKCREELGAKLDRYYNALPANERSALLSHESHVCRKGVASDHFYTYSGGFTGQGKTEEDCIQEASSKRASGWYYDWHPVWKGWCRVIIGDAATHDKIMTHSAEWYDAQTSHSCVRNVRLLPPRSNCYDEFSAKLDRYYNALPANEKSALLDEGLVCRQGWANDYHTTYSPTAIWGRGWIEEDCKKEAAEQGASGWYFGWHPLYAGWCRIITDATLTYEKIIGHTADWTDNPDSHSCITVSKSGWNRRLAADFQV